MTKIIMNKSGKAVTVTGKLAAALVSMGKASLPVDAIPEATEDAKDDADQVEKPKRQYKRKDMVAE